MTNRRAFNTHQGQALPQVRTMSPSSSPITSTSTATTGLLLRNKLLLLIVTVTLILFGVFLRAQSSSSSSFSSGDGSDLAVPMFDRRTKQISSVFTSKKPLLVHTLHSSHPVAQKKQKEFAATSWIDHKDQSFDEQMKTMKQKSVASDVQERYQALWASNETRHLADELYKFHVIYTHGGVWLDASSPLLHTLDSVLSYASSDMSQPVAVQSSTEYFPDTVHGALLYIPTPKSPVAARMIDLLTETPIEKLRSSPLLLPRALFKATQEDETVQWNLLQQRCTTNPLLKTKGVSTMISRAQFRITHHCPAQGGYCCQIYNDKSVVMMTQHPLLPYQVLPPTDTLPKPLNMKEGFYDEEDLPFISTVREAAVHKKPSDLVSPNFYDTLARNKCLPSDLQCAICLRNKDGADCSKCKKVCPCFCKTLCHVSVDEKFVTKELVVQPPLYARDPARLVPRIVHQTWFEAVTKEKYPNQSRLIESFKQSGWEYKFYTDDMAVDFLATHFPVEVKEAYHALRPGAFKADLFRYCVLLIHGGVYADMDVMLESNLDAAVAPDVGFMVPIDEPGKPVDHRMCLWNGFIAAAPGHPFLAKVIEMVVNNVRNRYTSVDVDAMFCPNPELSVLHAFDTLFTAGPCIMGSVVNRVLGRHGQSQFESGEIQPWLDDLKEATMKATSFVQNLDGDDQLKLRIPGRTIILHQDKWDMGAHRFTLEEQNLVVAATDMPDYDDRKNLERNDHYSKTHAKTGIYGLENLYKNNNKANEDIKFYIDGSYALERVQA